MAGLSINPADIAKARESGYSDNEIADFLSAKSPDQFKAARDAGYSDKEILAHLTGDDNKPSGVIAGAREGFGNVIHGASETLKQFAGMDTSRGETAASAVKPENYKGTSVIPSDTWYDPRTYNYSQIPQAVAEAAPGVMTDIAAAKAAAKLTKNPLVGTGAGIASYLLRTRGDAAKNDAAIRTGNPNAEPETQDKTRSLITGALEAAPQALGLGRFLPGGKIAQTAGQAVAKPLITGLAEGGAGAASNAISQAGATIGTPGGLKVDMGQVGSAGVAQGLTGAALAAPRAAADIHNINKYAPLSGDNHDATTAIVNRVNTALDGQAVTTKSSYEALRTADEGVRDELKAAVKPIKGDLDSDTADALKRATKGRPLTDTDLQTIRDNTSPDIAFLARQAHAATLIKGLGNYGQGQFVGGLANQAENHVRALQNPLGAGISAGLGAAGLGGHAASLFAYGPSTLAAIAGGYAGLRGIDALSGARVPLKGVIDRFSDPSAQVRLPAPAEPAAAPVSPTGPKVPFDPGVANGGALLATGQSPWQTPDSPKAPTPAEMNEQVKSALLMAAARRKAASPVQDPEAANADILGMLRMAAARRKVAADQAAATAPQPEQTAPALDVKALNEQVKGSLLMASARRKATARRAALGIGEESPLVQDNGGVNFLSQPGIAKEMAALVSAARSHAALTRTPEQEGQGAPEAPTGPSPAPQGPAPEAPAAPVPVAPAPAPSGPSGTNGSPVDPLLLAQKALAKISKKSGAKSPETDAGFENGYTPLTDEQLYGKGLSDEAFATHELGREKNSGKDIQNEQGYMDSIIHDRQKRRNILADLTGELGDDSSDHELAAKLLEDLHHTRRAARAHAAIQHYTALMKDQSLAAAIKSRLDRSYINSTWTK